MLGGTTAFIPFSQPAHAGEVGARINKAVTESDLGISVRRSVVRGAQVMDQVDGQWEQFSDRFGLGSNRSRQDAKPKPKVIPNPLPLDATVAAKMLDIVDTEFVAASGISSKTLSAQIQKVADLVRPSFERSGVSLDGTLQTRDQFNFLSYVHFKAFGDLLVEKNVNFPRFRADFERQVGQKLVLLFMSDYKPPSISPKDNLQEAFQQRMSQVDELFKRYRERGLVAATETSAIEADRLADWADDLSDLQFSVALDGDITMQSQILLQEQGFRFYPDYAKVMLATVLQMEGQDVSIDAYYLDTDYNSDPNLFEVKEVLLNVVIESK
jgi:hypothetical protein